LGTDSCAIKYAALLVVRKQECLRYQVISDNSNSLGEMMGWKGSGDKKEEKMKYDLNA
jgi:hypothetical protein